MWERLKLFLFGGLLIGAAVVMLTQVDQPGNRIQTRKLQIQQNLRVVRSLFEQQLTQGEQEESMGQDESQMWQDDGTLGHPGESEMMVEAEVFVEQIDTQITQLSPPDVLDTDKAAKGGKGAKPAPKAAAKPAAAVPEVAVVPEMVPEDADGPVDYRSALPEVRDDFTCGDKKTLRWEGREGFILLEGHPVQIKGVTWSGMETQRGVLDGVAVEAEKAATATKPIDDFITDLKSAGFNAVRVPVSLSFALTGTDAQYATLNAFVNKAADNGILVMLVMKTLDRLGAPQKPEDPKNLWYNSRYQEEDFVKGWTKLLKEFSTRWNVFAIDILDTPGPTATWSNVSPTTDINKLAERLIPVLATNVPQYTGLFLVQGLNGSRKYMMLTYKVRVPILSP